MVKDGKDSLWALASEFPRLRCQISELNSAISIYQKQGCWPCALHLLQLTNAMEIATLVSYNAGMAGSPWKMAAVMLKQLKMKGFKSDIISYNSNLSAVAGKNSWCRALQFFKELCRNRLSPTVVTSSAMISGCEESWQLALSFAKLAPSNIISQNALLSAMAKGQQWRGALNLFEEVCFSKSLKYTVATFNALMSAYAKSSQWQGALCTLKEMRFRDVQADLITLNSVLDACSRSGEWQVAVQLLCDFEAQGLQVDEVSMSAVVSACEEVKEWQAAVSLLYSAVQRSCADRMTCNAAISACGLASKWQHSLTILDFMISFSTSFHPHSLAMQVSIVTYNSTISACEKSEFWYEDVITCNAMLGSCAQRLEWRRALNAIVAKDNDGLGNGGTNVISYSTSLMACEKSWRWQRAMSLFEFCSNGSLVIDSTAMASFASALSVYQRLAEWQQALRLFRQLDCMEAATLELSSLVLHCSPWRWSLFLMKTAMPAVAQAAVANRCLQSGQSLHTLQVLRDLQESAFQAATQKLFSSLDFSRQRNNALAKQPKSCIYFGKAMGTDVEQIGDVVAGDIVCASARRRFQCHVGNEL
eukprot:symbB.v1.2.029151.t3/scaffold3149.1/size62434/4